MRDSNPRPHDYESGALPAELIQHSSGEPSPKTACIFYRPLPPLSTEKYRLCLPSFCLIQFVIIFRNRSALPRKAQAFRRSSIFPLRSAPPKCNIQMAKGPLFLTFTGSEICPTAAMVHYIIFCQITFYKQLSTFSTDFSTRCNSLF